MKDHSYLIPVVCVGTIALTESYDVIKGAGFTMRPVIGGFVLGGFLYAINAVEPRLGLAFGVLILAVTVIEYGPTVFDKLVPQNSNAPTNTPSHKTRKGHHARG